MKSTTMGRRIRKTKYTWWGTTGLTTMTTPSFRFNALQEELIELPPVVNSDPQDEEQAVSTPNDSVREGSPFRRFGKRSTSVDTGGDGTVPDHPWSFFNGIREKIDNKLDEMKKERQQKLNERKLKQQDEGRLSDDERSVEDDKSDKVLDSKDPSGSKASVHTPVSSHSTTGLKVKSKFADLKRKFKPDVTGEEKEGVTYNADSDEDVVEIAEEAGADETLRPRLGVHAKHHSQFHTKLAFSCLPASSARAPGLIESVATLAVSNLKPFLLATALVGVYFSVYPLLVAFLLGSLCAMELSALLDWIRETFFLWTDSNSEYLITTNPYLMTQPVPIFDAKSLKPLQPHKLEYVGWLNEFKSDYSPEKYHLSLTETVYAQLTGSLLRVSEPRTKIPKRAVWNEPQLKLLFNVTRLYNISGCQVMLLPKGIIRQRIWNRKYPICVVLRTDSHVGMKFRNKDQLTINEEEPWLPFEIPDAKDRDSKNPSPTPGTPSSGVQTETPGSAGKVKSKSTESFLTLHETLKMNLEKAKQERETKVRRSSPVSSKSQVPVRNKVSSLKLEGDIREEICDELNQDSVPAKPNTLKVPKPICDIEDDETEVEDNGEELCDDDAMNVTDASPDVTFHIVEHGDTKVQCLYLFARTDRDKELWYRRLKAATTYYSVQTEEGGKAQHFLMQSETLLKEVDQNESYVKMMSNLHQTMIPTLPSSAKESTMPRTVTDLKDEGEVTEQLMFLNALLGRSLFDVFRNQRLRAQFQDKLQRKLNAIRVPRFLGALNIKKLELSNSSPVITQASKPRLDENGIWFELDVVFEGTYRIQVDTKLILMNLKKSKDISLLSCDNSSNPSSPTKENTNPSKLAALHSDIEDSGETSSDNDEKRLRILAEQNLSGELAVQNESSAAGLTPNRMLRMMDKFTNSKMFDKLTDTEVVRKFMQVVANKDISLFVELQGLAGRLVLNIPPPPSDRLWYGFKGNPRLWLHAYPKFGDTDLSFVSNVLQKLICTEFQKVVVLPNMDDFVLEGLVEDPLS